MWMTWSADSALQAWSGLSPSAPGFDLADRGHEDVTARPSPLGGIGRPIVIAAFLDFRDGLVD
jgi:hypothetical protein